MFFLESINEKGSFKCTDQTSYFPPTYLFTSPLYYPIDSSSSKDDYYFKPPVGSLSGSGEGLKEKLFPLIQGPSDTKELHMSRWLNEIRKPESLLAPDLLAFSVQVPQQGDDCRNSGKVLLIRRLYPWISCRPGTTFIFFIHSFVHSFTFIHSA